MSFAVASIFAIEQAYMLEKMAVPDFVAGFVYGMTGDNHLMEIEACYDGGSDVVADVQKAVSKIESGSYITGFAEVGKIIYEFPATLTTCKNMDSDIAAIESWATIFTEPEELAKTVGTNWLKHHKTIKKDLAAESADWATGDYFQAGIDTALAMTEAVGPIPTSTNEVGVELLAGPEFVAGFIEHLTGDLKLTELDACLASTTSLEPILVKIFADLKQKKVLKAILQVQKFILNLQAAIAPCGDLGDDKAILESWASIFLDPEALGETVTYNFIE